MKVIDAHTGLQVCVGDRIPLPVSANIRVSPPVRQPDGTFAITDEIPPMPFESTPEGARQRMRRGLEKNYYQALRIYPGFFRASMDMLMVDERGRKRLVSKQPLIVRWTHPGFFLQHVAFVPS